MILGSVARDEQMEQYETAHAAQASQDKNEKEPEVLFGNGAEESETNTCRW